MAEEDVAPDPDAWAGARVDRWVAMADRLDRQMAPITELLIAATGLRPGDRVLDIGCGTGPIARRAAEIVGPPGSVTGVDVAADMVAAALDATPEVEGSAPVRYVEADATTWTSADLFDVVISRFGVMFFDDPAAAFANLAVLTRPAGRLSVVVWDRRDRSDLFEVPLAAAPPWAESALEGRHCRQDRVGQRRMADEQVRKVRVGVVVAQRAAVEA